MSKKDEKEEEKLMKAASDHQDLLRENIRLMRKMERSGGRRQKSPYTTMPVDTPNKSIPPHLLAAAGLQSGGTLGMKFPRDLYKLIGKRVYRHGQRRVRCAEYILELGKHVDHTWITAFSSKSGVFKLISGTDDEALGEVADNTVGKYKSTQMDLLQQTLQSETGSSLEPGDVIIYSELSLSDGRKGDDNGGDYFTTVKRSSTADMRIQVGTQTLTFQVPVQGLIDYNQARKFDICRDGVQSKKGLRGESTIKVSSKVFDDSYVLCNEATHSAVCSAVTGGYTNITVTDDTSVSAGDPLVAVKLSTGTMTTRANMITCATRTTPFVIPLTIKKAGNADHALITTVSLVVSGVFADGRVMVLSTRSVSIPQGYETQVSLDVSLPYVNSHTVVDGSANNGYNTQLRDMCGYFVTSDTTLTVRSNAPTGNLQGEPCEEQLINFSGLKTGAEDTFTASLKIYYLTHSIDDKALPHENDAPVDLAHLNRRLKSY